MFPFWREETLVSILKSSQYYGVIYLLANFSCKPYFLFFCSFSYSTRVLNCHEGIQKKISLCLIRRMCLCNCVYYWHISFWSARNVVKIILCVGRYNFGKRANTEHRGNIAHWWTSAARQDRDVIGFVSIFNNYFFIIPQAVGRLIILFLPR